MDYTNLLNDLNKASLFDLYRLHAAIGKELNNPQRLSAFKQKLRIGMELSYFNSVENRLVNTRVLELRQKNVLVLDLGQQKQFVIPYYMFNIDDSDTEIHKNSKILTANNLKVGDCVGFNKNGQSIVGIVERLNTKTVTLVVNSGGRWRVSYSCLYQIHDAEFSAEQLVNYLSFNEM